MPHGCKRLPHGGLLDLAAARTLDLVDGAGERVTAHFAAIGEPGIMVLISPGQSDLTEVSRMLFTEDLQTWEPVDMAGPTGSLRCGLIGSGGVPAIGVGMRSRRVRV